MLLIPSLLSRLRLLSEVFLMPTLGGKLKMKKYFQFDELGTNFRREIIGGITTFLAMAYILAVNPLTLTLADVPDLPDHMRMDYGAVFVATAISAAIGSLIMGLIAKYPIGLAPGLGLNAFLLIQLS